jgi:ribosome-binding protein aMBF1 (putative translation factor)
MTGVRYMWRPFFSGRSVAKSKARLIDEEEKWQRAVRAVVKATRMDADVSRRELSETLGWPKDAVSNLENGRRVASGVDLIRIALALKIAPDALVRRILRWRMS